MKFAHIADCHIGSWSNHPDLRDYPVIAFEKSMDECKKEGVDFIIIAGDLFDTSLPSIDVLKRVASKLKQVSEAGMRVYVVPGSHDYSPTGKTMISVLESAGLLMDVCKFDIADGKVNLKFTVDEKTGTKLTGLMGRKGGLDIDYYKNIEVPDESGFKIFVFHAAISEYRPDSMKDMLAVSFEDIPKNFDYYATGHVHTKFFDEKHMIVFPGELFPTSFDEMEEYNGGFVIAEKNDKSSRVDVTWKDNRLFDVVVMKLDVNGKTPAKVEKEVIEKISASDVNKKCLLMKLEGILDGKISDIDFRSIFSHAAAAGAKIIKKSTSGIKTKDMEDITIRASSTEEIERSLIDSYKDQLKLRGVDDIGPFVVSLMRVLEDEKFEDETNAVFEERIKINAKKVLGL